MNRSKLFLGISAGVLAVVAFAAGKAVRFTQRLNCYYHVNSTSPCTILAILQFYSVGSQQATSGRPAHALLFTYNHGSTCETPCYKNHGD